MGCQWSWSGRVLSMGSTRSDDEKPPHRVCFDEPFWIDRTEVTNGQFAAFMGMPPEALDRRTTSTRADHLERGGGIL